MSEAPIFFHNLTNDKHHTLDGLPYIQCIFCNMATVEPLESDMRFHLSDMHRKDLIIKLPLYGKGYNMEYRTAVAMNMIKETQMQQTQQILYDHRTAKFAPAFDPLTKLPIERKKKK
jgi:hypothetical protein